MVFNIQKFSKLLIPSQFFSPNGLESLKIFLWIRSVLWGSRLDFLLFLTCTGAGIMFLLLLLSFLVVTGLGGRGKGIGGGHGRGSDGGDTPFPGSMEALAVEAVRLEEKDAANRATVDVIAVAQAQAQA
ncbi:hypothetical protein U1Q18_002349 [Sarracenia purpurea var. burkii]